MAIKKMVVENAKKEELEAVAWYLIKDFEAENLPFNENITKEFIVYLLLMGMDETDIHTLIKENADRIGIGYYNIVANRLREFPRMLFWRQALEPDIRGLNKKQRKSPFEHANRINKAVWDIAEYIVQNEMELLIANAGEYCEKYKQELDQHDKEAQEILDLHNNVGVRKIPEHIARKEIDSLMEGIGRVFGKIGRPEWTRKDGFDKRCYYDFSPMRLTFNGWSKYNPHPLYPLELSERIKAFVSEERKYEFEYEPYFGEKEVQEDFDEEDGLGLESRRMVSDIDTKDDEILTKKDFYDKWDSLSASEEKYLRPQEYAKLIAKWETHLPIKLLREELDNGNSECIIGVLESGNEYAIRALLAVLDSKDYDVVIDGYVDTSLSGLKGDNAYVNYCRLLIILSTNESEWYSGKKIYAGSLRYTSPENKPFLDDIIGITKSNSVLGQKISKTLEESEVSLSYMTAEQFYEAEKSDNRFDRFSSDNAKVPNVLWDGYIDRGYNFKVRYWLHGYKELDLSNYMLGKDQCLGFREIALEKPYFFPECEYEGTDNFFYISHKTVNIMSHYLYEELKFPDFKPERYSELKRNVLWKLYKQNFIETAYRDFKQREWEKPQLPIIPEYMEFLLSKAGFAFSTAIEGPTHCEYRTFGAESRIQNIKKLCRDKVLQQEEADKLIAMAENRETDYYPWSDAEIKKCLLPYTVKKWHAKPDPKPTKKMRANLEPEFVRKLRASLEPKFMVEVFNRSIRWVIGHRDSELWETAPWFGMRIFSKSYADRPSVWEKHLLEIAHELNDSKDEDMLLRVCFAMGHLREPLGGDVPIALQKIADKQGNDFTKKLIQRQRNLFNRENFNKGHHRSPRKRVELCKKELIRGQNMAALKARESKE